MSSRTRSAASHSLDRLSEGRSSLNSLRRSRPTLARATQDAIERLEQRRLFTTINWSGSAGDGNWFTPGNWVGGVVPGSSDSAILDVPGNAVITVPASTPAFSVGSITNRETLNLPDDGAGSSYVVNTIDNAGTLTVGTVSGGVAGLQFNSLTNEAGGTFTLGYAGLGGLGTLPKLINAGTWQLVGNGSSFLVSLAVDNSGIVTSFAGGASINSSFGSTFLNEPAGIIAATSNLSTPSTNLGIFDNSPPAITNRVLVDSRTLKFTFSAPLSTAGLANWAAVMQVTRSGGDGVFGNGNDINVSVTGMVISGNDVLIGFTAPLVNDVYRLNIPATQMVMNTAGNPVLGSTDYVTQFTVNAVAGPTLGVTLPDSTLVEGQTVTGTVSRTGDTSTVFVVNLAAAPTGQVTIPSTVTIPAGSATATFAITAISDGITEAATQITLTASATNATAGSFIVNVVDPPALYVQVTAGSLYEGQSAVGIISRSGGDLTTALMVDLTGMGSQLSMPVEVTIPANATSARFSVVANTDSVVESAASVAITAASTVEGVSSATEVRVLDAATTASAYRADFDGTNGNNASSAWTQIASSSDTNIGFNFDYSTVGVPPSPRGTGTTRGLRLSVNDAAPAASEAVTLSPNNLTLPTGSFDVSFDVWMNSNGPFPLGGNGSTQDITLGVGHDGLTNNFDSVSGSGDWFAATGDGNSSTDYAAYNNSAVLTDQSYYFTTDDNGPNHQNASNLYYKGHFDPIDVSAVEGSQGSNQTGILQAGAIGFKWRQFDIARTANGVMTWTIDGVPIATQTLAAATAGGRVAIGLMDLFPSVAASPTQEFALIDNVSIVVPPTVSIDLQAGSDSGTSNTDNITNVKTPTFDVAVNQAGTIGLDVTGDGVADATRIVGSAGTYAIRSTSLADGARTATAIFTPAGGAAASAVTASLGVTIDTVGPRVASASIYTDGNATFTFDQNVDASTVSSSDLGVAGPSGAVAGTLDHLIGPNGVRFVFPTQSIAGNYIFTLGPDIRDAAGNGMDSNSNAVSGEASDAYVETHAVSANISSITANVDSRVNGINNSNGDVSGGLQNPLKIALSAGTYRWNFVANVASGLSHSDPGANFSAWTYNTPWLMNFVAFPSGTRVYNVTGPSATSTFHYESTTTYSSPAEAFNAAAAANAGGVFTLSAATTLELATPDSGLSDNTGGVSIHITRLAPSVSIALDGASDSGASGSDGITNVQRTTFNVTINQPGAIYLDLNGDGIYGDGQVSYAFQGAGSYPITSPYPLQEGSFNVRAEFDPTGGTPTYSAPLALTIDTLGPRVTTSVLTRGSPNWTDHITFNEPIDVGSVFNGAVSVSRGGTAISGVTFDGTNVTFPAQTTPGTYTLTVGPAILDIAGNFMDQNNNGVVAEPVVDTYSTTFNVTAPATGQVIYVDHNATGLADGNSWATAFPDLQTALSYAAAGQDIHVADGTYTPTSGTDRSATFQLKSGVGIYGGYAGVGATNPDTRDAVGLPTLFSGDIGIVGATSDNSLHVVTGSGVSTAAVLDGVTIASGNANSNVSSSVDAAGGGMLVVGGRPTLNQVTFTQNFANQFGGAFAQYSSSTTVISASSFIENNVGPGGRGAGVFSDSSSLTATQTSFRRNSGGASTAGIGMILYGGSATLDRLTFAGNHSSAAEPALSISNATVLVNNSSFIGNDAPSYAGIYEANSTRLTVVNSSFTGNSAAAGASAIFVEPNSVLTLQNSIIWGNGGAFAIGGTGEKHISNSDVQDGVQTASGNIAADPKFARVPSRGADNTWGTADDDYGDLHLQAGSPAINAGSNAAIPAGVTTDIAGNARLVDGTVDMGAYENQQVSTPDLVVTNLQVVAVGAQVTVSWSVLNQGTAPATAPGGWYDHVELRSPTGVLIGENIINFAGTLAPGASNAGSRTFTLPADYAAASVTATVTADDPTLFGSRVVESNSSGTGETNNVSTITVSIDPISGADLVIRNVHITGTSDGQVQVTWDLLNQGNVAATDGGLLITGGNLSSTSGFYSGISAAFNGSLAAGASVSQSNTFRLPTGYSGGDFTATIVADSNSNISEHNATGTGETNNTSTATAPFPLSSYPDLVIRNVHVTGTSDGQVLVTWDVLNQGNAAADDGGLVVTGGTVSTPSGNLTGIGATFSGPLAAGASVSQSNTFRLPAGYSDSGDLTATIVADSNSNIFEYNASGNGESNNTASATAAFPLAGYSDLVIRNVHITGTSDGQVQVTWDLLNQGNAAADDGGLFVTGGTVSTPSGTLTGIGATFSGSLAAGASVSQSNTFRLPTGFSDSGDLTATIVADSNSNIFEYNASGNGESNNTASATAAFPLAGYPDLVIRNVHITGTSDGQVQVTWDLLNQGNAAADDGGLFVTGGTVSTPSGTLTGIGATFSGSLAAGASVSQSNTFRLPTGFSDSGDLTATIVADSNSNIFEYNAAGTGETNNTASATAAFPLSSYPDLVIRNIHITGTSDGQVQISWDVLNQGNAAASDGGLVLTSGLLSSPSGFQAGIGANFSGSLAAGASVSQSNTFQLPTGYGGGDLTATIVADSNSNIFEYNAAGTGESNNTASLTVGGPALADLVATVPTPVGGFSEKSFEARFTVTNNGSASTIGAWSDEIFLSPVSGGGDIFFGELTSPSTLAPGQSYSRTFRANLPRGLSGQYRLKVVVDANRTQHETNIANNTTASDPFTITLAPFADLQVTSVPTPNAITAGDLLHLSWTVANKGAGATDAALWYDDVYLSQSPDGIDASATRLGSARNVTYLASGESYKSLDFTYAIPAKFAGGTYYVYVVTDANNAQYEGPSGDANNTTRSAVGFTVTPIASPAHFTVAPVVVAPDSNVLAGQAVYITWTVKNTGSKAITGNWSDAVYLSPSANFNDSGSTLLTIVPITSAAPLNADGSYTHSALVTIPANYSGSGFIVIDPDHNETASGTNGVGAGDVDKSTGSAPIQVVAPPAPSLHVGLVNSPAVAQAGNSLTVSWHVSNEGHAATTTSGWSDAVYLSPTPTLQFSGANAAILLGRRSRVGGLDPVASYDASSTFALPTSLSGDYYVFVRTDVDNSIAVEEDNAVLTASRSGAINVAPYSVVSPPTGGTTTTVSDLVIDDVSSPATVNSGTAATVSWTIHNAGPDAVGNLSWVDHVYLSDHNGITGNGVIDLGVVQRSGPLVAGASYSSSRTVLIPNGLSGAYHFIVVANANGAVNEVPGGSANNIATHDTTIVARATPALVASAIGTDATVVSGDTTHLTWTIRNTGTGGTLASENSWSDGVYISDSSTLTSSAIRIGTYNHNGGLSAGGSYSAALDVTIPLGLSGLKVIIIVPDVGGQVYQGPAAGAGNASLSVNVSATPFAILTTSNVVAPATGQSGQPVTITWHVANSPDVAATKAGTWYDTVYLSQDQYFDPATAIAIGSLRHNGNLAPGTSYDGSLTAALPDNVSGPYYVIVVADVTRNVYNAGNDTSRIAAAPDLTNIDLSSIADLATTDVIAPATGETGQNASPAIEWTVTNLGENAAQGTWLDSVYLSSDSTFDGNDKLIARVEHDGGLASGASYLGSSNAPLPADIVPGHYYIIVRANAQGTIRESDLTNNSATSTTTTSLDVAALTIGQKVDGTIHDGENIYYRVSVGAGDPLNFTATFAAQFQGNFYVSYGRPPSASEHDFEYSRTADLTQKISIPNATEGTYYILLSGAAAAGAAGKSYSLLAETPTFGITSTDLSHASNRGSATLTITGAKLGQDTVVSLVKADGSVAETASAVRWKDESTLWTTFDLRSLPAGVYSLRATLGSGSSTLTGAFIVDHSSAGSLSVRAAAPGVIRAGTTGQVTFYYDNLGNTDVVAPLLNLSADGAFLRLSTGELVGSTQILGINTTGPAGILPPGYSGQVTYTFKLADYAPNAANTYQFAAKAVGSTSTPIDWDGLEASSRPASVSEAAWDGIWQNLHASVGDTVSDLQSALAEAATALSEVNRYTTSIEALLGFKYTQADAGLLPGALETHVDLRVPTPGLSLELSRSIYGSISARNRSGLLGIGWQTPWDTRLLVGGSGQRIIDLATGEISFYPDGKGNFIGPAGVGALVQNGVNFIFTDTSGTQQQFNGAGELAFIRDKNGNQLTASRVNGLVTRIEHSNRAFINFAYDASGHILSASASNGDVATYTYDVNGRLITATTDEGTTRFTYNDSSNNAVANALLTIARPGGGATTFTYDSQGRRTGSAGTGNDLAIQYDDEGGITFVDALNNKTKYRLTDFLKPGRLTDPRGNVTRIEYDDSGNPTRQVLPGGLVYRYQYNAAGQVTGVIDPLGGSSTYTYVPGTNFLANVSDARGNHTTYSYDAAGNLRLTSLPGNVNHAATYDSRGLPLVTTNARGETVTSTYGDAGELLTQSLSTGAGYAFTYDANGNILTATDARGVTTFTYDAAGRVTHVAYPGSKSVTIEYDAAGRRTRLTDGAGYDVRYFYDAAGRLAALRDAGGIDIASFVYDPAGRLIRQNNSNGTYSIRFYDSAGNVSSVGNYAASGTAQSKFDYDYNAFNQVSREQTLDGVWTYSYDAIGQLRLAKFASTNSAVSSVNLMYSYDAVGNRVSTSRDDGAGGTPVIIDYATKVGSDEYSTVGGTPFSYDADGNLLSDGSANYTYDALGRMTTMTVGGATTTFSYDALGRHSSGTTASSSSNYVYDPVTGNAIGEFSASGALQAYNIFGTDGLVARTSNGAGNFFSFDANGRAADLTGADGSVAQSYAFDPFGNVLQSQGSVLNPFQSAGQSGGTTDAPGITTIGGRTLSSVLGRSLNASAGLAGGDSNVYRYLANAWASRTSDQFSVFQNLTSQLLASIAGRVTPKTFSLDAQLAAPPQTQIAVSTSVVAGRSSDGSSSPAATSPPANSGNGSSGPGTTLGGILGTLRAGLFGGTLGTSKLVTGIGYTGAGGSALGYQSTSLDPNSLTGPQGYGADGIVGLSAPQAFRIDFENTSTATAPAQIVRVEYALDPNWDWRTISLQSIAFHDTTISLTNAGSFHSEIVDLRPQGRNLLVLVNAALDSAKGLLIWTFTSIDPDTGEAPTDPSVGLLPPDDAAGDGRGFVTFSMRGRADVPTGSLVKGQATITFDDQPPIVTNEISNVLDTGAPTATISSHRTPNSGRHISVLWSAQDDAGGSGIASYDVYVATDDGEFVPWIQGTTLTDSEYVGVPGHSYTFEVVAQDNAGNTGSSPIAQQTPTLLPATTFSTAHIFYNNSAYDGHDPSANAADDAAIAPDKTPLLPGSKATFKNYSSFSKGINGVMIDVAGDISSLTAADFIFRSGNTIQPNATWVAVSNPTSISIRPIAGQPGMNRITLIWPDNAIQKTWLEVTLRVTDATGLANPAVFYFGNAIGESDNSALDAAVTVADALRVRSNFTSNASISNIYDFDRDGDVDAVDMQLALANATAGSSVLVLLNPFASKIDKSGGGKINAGKIVDGAAGTKSNPVKPPSPAGGTAH